MTALFDIFSKPLRKQKARKINDIKVIADYRERNSLIVSELVHLGLKIEFRQLRVADYLVNDVAIERKTVSDFISSMINRRLLNQLTELQQYKNNLLIIEGIDEQELYNDENHSGVNPNSVRGFLLSILIKHKIPIIFTKNYKDSAKFISVIAKRKPRELSLNVSKKSLNKKERLQFILESFPGIGPKSARKLLEHFKTLKNVINASEKELEKAIGKKAKIMKNLIDEIY